MTNNGKLVSVEVRKQPEEELTWTEHLRRLILPSWRPDEFDFAKLLYIPETANPHTALNVCIREGCGVLIEKAVMCPKCKTDWQAAELQGITQPEWAATPRQRREVIRGCSVPGCERGHHGEGLCRSHVSTYSRQRRGPDCSPQDWIEDRRPQAFTAAVKCPAPLCQTDRSAANGLCDAHARRFSAWRRRVNEDDGPESLALWFERETEPPMDAGSLATYASNCATPFGLIKEPLRWEYLYAVQQRDLTGRAHMAPVDVRSTYLSLRRSGWDTAVGRDGLGRPLTNPNLSGFVLECQRLIDDAHREWSGIDARDPRILYLRDLPLRKSNRRIGPKARIDLRGIQQDWIFESVAAWCRAAARGPAEFPQIAAAWTVASEVISARGTTRATLGAADMGAIVDAIRNRWPSENYQRRHISALSKVMSFANDSDELEHYWAEVPARFAINPALHQPSGEKTPAEGDEPFRFVPQPIVDWVMDHLHLIERSDAYLTAEARALIYIHERCGRRTGETLKLLDDCMHYDDEGSPFLKWRQGKPPYSFGKPLPIHQETHDLIRQWQELKREKGMQSQWLFPSQDYSNADRPYNTEYLSRRVNELLKVVQSKAPFEGRVEGAEGNLIYFDLLTIDPYSFRHAFAQRFADATDEDGRSTTPPDVLQSYMGHKNYNTTMAYYEVTTKRRKKALDAVPPRRLNLHGKAVQVNRQRDGFTKVAVTLGHCSEPQNVAANGHFCALEHSCESCPFFLVDPLERDAMFARLHHLKVKLERARVITSPQHILDHYEARIADCTTIIDGIDAYIQGLPEAERGATLDALALMADIRRRATAPRTIDLRQMLNA